ENVDPRFRHACDERGRQVRRRFPTITPDRHLARIDERREAGADRAGDVGSQFTVVGATPHVVCLEDLPEFYDLTSPRVVVSLFRLPRPQGPRGATAGYRVVESAPRVGEVGSPTTREGPAHVSVGSSPAIRTTSDRNRG